MRMRTGLAGLFLAGWAATSAAQTPNGTEFTYQGRLTDAGSPANGVYDLRFVLQDAATGGAALGQADRDDVVVAGGLFTVVLDFGGSPFFAHKRWLDIGVRPGASTGAYTSLTPRQELTHLPFAITAMKVGWPGLVGTPAGFADNVDDDALGALTCANGQVPKWSGSGFSCAADVDTVGWSLTGNAGTNPATNFLGTTDLAPLELRVAGLRVLRLEPTNLATPNVIVGSNGNSITAGVIGGTVSGGGLPSAPNQVTDHFGTVGGGLLNRAGDGDGNLDDGGTATVGGGSTNVAGGLISTVSGGQGNNATVEGTTVAGGFANLASGIYASVGGGVANAANAEYAVTGGGRNNVSSSSHTTVGGGFFNVANNVSATVGGGDQNVASGFYATVPGGHFNQAGGESSFAAGRQAKVRNPAESGHVAGDHGTFVWADNTIADFVSTGPHQFLVRALGGVGINTNAPLGDFQVGGATDSSAFRLGHSGARHHLISNRDMVFNGFDVIAAPGDAVFTWRRNTTRFDENTFVDLLRLRDNGELNVLGNLTKASGSFKIDHPLDPENQYLYHSFVESPDMKNVYDGVAVLDGRGEAVVELPEWFEALNRDFRYQLTAIGAPAPALHVAGRVRDNRFHIAGGAPGLEVSWQVTGIRKDAYAEKHRVPIEQEKPEGERGTYLHPDAWGKER